MDRLSPFQCLYPVSISFDQDNMQKKMREE